MKFSIITINYNNRDGLEKTILSVINQTCRDYEFIIIDGGSTDGSKEIIKKYKDQINYWVSEPDKGIYNAMNKGSRVASGNYFNYLNSGDCYYNSSALQHVVDLNSQADIITGCHNENEFHNIGRHGITLLILYKWFIDHQTSFIKKELCRKLPYDEKYKIVSDWKFFIEALIFNNCSFEFTDKILINEEPRGISVNQSDLNTQEKKAVLNELFPPRVLQDYEILSKIDPNMLKLIPQLSQSYSVNNLVCKLAKFLLKLRNFFNPVLHVMLKQQKEN